MRGGTFSRLLCTTETFVLMVALEQKFQSCKVQLSKREWKRVQVVHACAPLLYVLLCSALTLKNNKNSLVGQKSEPCSTTFLHETLWTAGSAVSSLDHQSLWQHLSTIWFLRKIYLKQLYVYFNYVHLNSYVWVLYASTGFTWCLFLRREILFRLLFLRFLLFFLFFFIKMRVYI